MLGDFHCLDVKNSLARLSTPIVVNALVLIALLLFILVHMFFSLLILERRHW